MVARLSTASECKTPRVTHEVVNLSTSPDRWKSQAGDPLPCRRLTTKWREQVDVFLSMGVETACPVVIGRTNIGEKTTGQTSCNHVESQADGEQFVGDRMEVSFFPTVALNVKLAVLGLGTHRNTREVRPSKQGV